MQRGFYLCHQRAVLAEGVGIQLGIAAAEQQAVQIIGQLRVVQRRKFHQLCAQLLKQLQIIRIVKGERLIPRHTDAQRCGIGRGQLYRGDCKSRSLRSNFEQQRQVDGLHRLFSQLFQPLLQVADLLCGHKPKMPAFQRAVGHLRHISADGDIIALLDERFDLRVDAFADLVEDDALDLAVRLVGKIASQLGSDGNGHSLAVEHQHRRLGGFGKLPGGSLGGGGNAVVVAHHPFDEGKGKVFAVFLQQVGSGRLIGEEEVQIARRDTQHLPVEHRVDVVRSALEADRVLPHPGERLQNGAGDGRFAASAGSSCQHKPWGHSGHLLFLLWQYILCKQAEDEHRILSHHQVQSAGGFGTGGADLGNLQFQWTALLPKLLDRREQVGCGFQGDGGDHHAHPRIFLQAQAQDVRNAARGAADKDKVGCGQRLHRLRSGSSNHLHVV